MMTLFQRKDGNKGNLKFCRDDDALSHHHRLSERPASVPGEGGNSAVAGNLQVLVAVAKIKNEKQRERYTYSLALGGQEERGYIHSFARKGEIRTISIAVSYRSQVERVGDTVATAE